MSQPTFLQDDFTKRKYVDLAVFSVRACLQNIEACVNASCASLLDSEKERDTKFARSAIDLRKISQSFGLWRVYSAWQCQLKARVGGV
jgi:hypothetical protein